jgi:hypothetical protein
MEFVFVCLLIFVLNNVKACCWISCLILAHEHVGLLLKQSLRLRSNTGIDLWSETLLIYAIGRKSTKLRTVFKILHVLKIITLHFLH